jgi:hypothetical protein
MFNGINGEAQCGPELFDFLRRSFHVAFAWFCIQPQSFHNVAHHSTLQIVVPLGVTLVVNFFGTSIRFCRDVMDAIEAGFTLAPET